MYIADYFHEHEGSVWTPEYTAEVMRIIGEIEKQNSKTLANYHTKPNHGSR